MVSRGFRAEDLPLAYEWHRHTTTCLNGESYTLPQFLRTVQEALIVGRSWTISREGSAVGIVIFDPIRRMGEVVDGGIHICLARSEWGKGTLQAAAPEILRELFTEVPTLQRLSGFTPSHYRPGLAVASQLGFAVEGTLRDAVTINNVTRDLIITGLTRKMWQQLYNKEQAHGTV